MVRDELHLPDIAVAENGASFDCKDGSARGIRILRQK